MEASNDSHLHDAAVSHAAAVAHIALLVLMATAAIVARIMQRAETYIPGTKTSFCK
jgi:hypothetical protein